MVDWEAFYGAFRQPGFVPGYEIQNYLGGGAFGEVYKARKSSIGKPYAIKFLKVDGDETKDGVERELEHVRLFAAIDHPNLVTIEDMGMALSVPYLVMGYAGEDTLARRIQQRDLEQRTALRFFVQAARGVLALHDRRLAHFDLKPGNIFLKGDTARVGDYGLAKLLTEGRQTLSFGRGTPLYMAPEMLRNRADHRADIYSLGVILFECLTFHLPFESEFGLGVVMRETDEPPKYPDGFPARLIPVVSRCLRLNPDDRYGSVRELLDEMEQTEQQGDSIVMGPLQPGATPPPLPGAAAATGERPAQAGPPRRAEEAGQSRGPGAELRKAAQELARGAREVAQSAIEGVRGATGAARQAPRVTPAAPLREPPAAAAEPRSAGDAAPAGPEGSLRAASTGSTPALASAPALAADIVSTATLEDAEEAAEAPPEPARRPPSAHTSGSLRAEAIGTIPVPPRSESGPLGTVFEAGMLGTEMIGALVGWPLRVGTRLLARFADTVAHAVPGVFGRLLRILVFFAGFFLLGGICALVLVAAFTLVAA